MKLIDLLRKIIAAILARLHPATGSIHFLAGVSVEQDVVPIPTGMQEVTVLQLTDAQQVALQIVPVDAKGQQAQVDGIPAWSVSNPTVASIVVSQDGLGAVLKAGLPGTTQVNVSADADLGTGVKTISGALDVTVVPGQAASLSIETGPIEAQS